jgi:putative addiction module component (TIGR02574 family)
MNDHVKKLTEEAAKLSPDDRAELVEGILDTLVPTSPEVDERWRIEALDRYAAYKRGEIPTVDFDEVLGMHRQRIDNRS